MHGLRGRVVGQQPDAARGVERVIAGPLQVVRELLDARLVDQGRERDTARWRGPRSRPRRGCRGPRTAARPSCSTAPCRRTRSARRARSRRGGAAHRSPGAGADRGPRHRASWRRRPRSGCPGWNGLPLASYQVSSGRIGCRRRPPSSPSSRSRAATSPPRSRIRIRLPLGARWRARVPPPAPLPMMMTSNRPSLDTISPLRDFPSSRCRSVRRTRPPARRRRPPPRPSWVSHSGRAPAAPGPCRSSPAPSS